MFHKILIANRGEIAVRLIRAARDMGIASVALHAKDDARSLHVRLADEAVALDATGPAAYLDIAAVVAAAVNTGCAAVHPGYGFLSERADFALACAAAGVVFIGPAAEHLALFGDKARARALALQYGVPLLPGTGAATLQQVQAFLAEQRPDHPGCGLMLKAVAGGGGRGMRAVFDAGALPEAFARCASEAQAAFGVGAVYAERLIARARHIELQLLGDGTEVVCFGERECSLQRRLQKLVEIAPSPALDAGLRERITDCALRMARAVGYRSLGTFEFLLDADSGDFVFIEVNPRLQVEHTVTEEVSGVDLVQAQIAIAAGASLASLGLSPPPPPRGFALQWRINAETLDATGQARPSSGRITRLEWPSGPGIRLDTYALAGAAPSPHYDTLLAKLIVSHRSANFAEVLRRSQRALAECRIDGLATNLPLLQRLAAHEALATNAVHTRWLEEHWAGLYAGLAATPQIAAEAEAEIEAEAEVATTLAVGAGLIALPTPMPCKLVELSVAEGDVVGTGQPVAVLEAMKMQHLLHAPVAARICDVRAAVGDYLAEAQLLLVLEPVDAGAEAQAAQEEAAGEVIRADLQRLRDRLAFTEDASRPEAVARRHAAGGRTARENVAELCDADSFVEYGALAIAAQSRRRSLDDLVRHTPADGMVSGIGTVNAAHFGPEASRCAVLAYDYTVLAGTQGWRNHHKKDRLLELTHRLKLPLVLFAEGGGGRPGDVDMPVVAGLNNHTFSQFAALSGQVPVVGIVHGRCFAGNAALLGCADVIIATRDSNIGMGGPAMIEGGGLGNFRPEDIGPSPVQHRNGVIDLLVADEAAAVVAARQYLSYFQGRLSMWEAPDAQRLRHAVPENRLRAYDVRKLLPDLFDRGSLLELRTGFGSGILTLLARIEGRPIGVLANNTMHLGGAIDAEAADKAARFMQLCNAHGLPMLALCDTPGFMVGPDIERQAQVRHVCRMFVVAAHLTVPYFTVVLRKGYGLGAQAMAAGGFDAPLFNVSWPTGEFGGMGLEGAVKLGYRKELQAAAEGAERDALYRRLVEQQYQAGSAINMAATLEIDAVIDPAHTRDWLVRGLDSAARMPRAATGARFVDTW
ncbi:MAG TPA: carboxyl transferase domain-containing protein [Rubrivivax sp.]|nr:carboxyl transferase domain-containing protein [Rubrivivax sp.]